MTGYADGETTRGLDVRVQAPQSASRSRGRGKDWYRIEAYEWMWRDDGLGLRPGAELMIYAAIYSASAHGGGVFSATNKSIGEALGYPRETVNRAVGSLCKRGFIWAVGEIRDGHGGSPAKCYAVSQRLIDSVLDGMLATSLDRGLYPEPEAAAGLIVGNSSGIENGATRRVDEKPAESGTVHGCGPSERPEDMQRDETSHSECDDLSHSQCDETSHVTKHHTPEQHIWPAETALFNNPLISTNHLSNLSTLSADQADPYQGEEEGRKEAEEDRPLTQAEELAFQSLLRASVRPVDAKFVDENRAEFKRLVCAGVPCDVILEAYGQYARYHREQAAAGGELRCMHLLTWLRQNPNKNIQYLLNAKDDEWVQGHRGAVRAATAEKRQRVAERRERVPNLPKRKYSHQEPKLDRCIDRNTVVWYVVDDRGGRLVQGSKGVMGIEEARRLYETMYEEETAGRR